MHTIRSLLVASTTLGFGTAALHAQQKTGTLRGVVNDKDFEGPIFEATVEIVELDRSAKTSSEGSYRITGVPPGTYTLRFTKPGYIGQTRRNQRIAAGQFREIDVELVGDFTVMEEFVVENLVDLGGSSEQSLLDIRFEDSAVIDAISSDLLQKAGASDVAQGMRLIAGATVSPDGKSAVVRGLPDRYVSAQMNGVRLPTADENKRAVELDQFPAAVVRNVSVKKTFTPDQQGDASGGAVDVLLKGVPDKPLFINWSFQTSYNSQATGRSNFLSYEGGGVRAFGRDDGRRDIQLDDLGRNWEGEVGVSRQRAPIDFKGSVSLGAMSEIDEGVRVGAFLTLFYERDSGFFDRGVDDSLWVERQGAGLAPRTFQGVAADGDFRTGLFDVTQGAQSIDFGGLATVGLESDNHKLSLVVLRTRSAEDKATLAEDTRGKQYFFPGHDPKNSNSAGFGDDLDGAKYLRLETLEYTERTTETKQAHGSHTFDFDVGEDSWFGRPKLAWTIARSNANFDQPDKRQFGAEWTPGYSIGTFRVPQFWGTYKPGANFTLGNLQRIWKEIDESSEQYRSDLDLPFTPWGEKESVLRFGWFKDRVTRSFNQDSYSNFSDNSTWSGPYETSWTKVFRYEDHPITESTQDVDYRGNIDIEALYVMLELSITDWIRLVGGLRTERTEVGVVNTAEEDALWYPKGAANGVRLGPGEADVAIAQRNKLPSASLIVDPLPGLTLRAAYNETIARQTFKELTPIIQQEFLGGPIFIGNPELEISDVENWDLRADWRPYDGGLFSASWFRKRIDKPIEYIQRIEAFDFTTAVNYPRGKLEGFELETRHDLGYFVDALEGLSVGVNATFIESEVTLPQEELDDLLVVNAPIFKRDMTNAPESLFNAFFTYELARTQTQVSLFYTVTGDTLVSGPGQSKNNFIPSIYAREFDTLNASFRQQLTEGVALRIQAKNITNPRIDTVYRSDYTGGDRTRTSRSRGVDYSISLSGQIRF